MQRREGFTLIELLVVLAIVALLLTLVLPRYFGSIEMGKERVLMENLRVTRDVIDKYYVDQGHYPETLSALVEQHYLKAIPYDPISESDSAWRLTEAPNTPNAHNAPNARGKGRGIHDLHSTAAGVSRDGKPFSEL
jgi:general secretion pathway protein G